jgi:hypothetical protein
MVSAARRPVRAAALLAVTLGCGVVACQLVAGIDRVDKEDPPPAEAGADAAPPPDPCAHVVPPPPPDVDDAPNDQLPDFYLAYRTVSLFPSDGTVPGFDLDRSCTCDRRADTAFLGASPCSAGARAVMCDTDGGVDNQMHEFLKSYAGFLDIDRAANVNSRIDRGLSTAIVVVTKYNGRANDKDIGFGIFTSEGIEDSKCPGSVKQADNTFPPGWCGEDTWNVSLDTVTPSSATSFVPKAVGNGYVTNYQLVTALTRGALTIPFGAYHLSIGSPVSSGRLVPLDAARRPLDTTRPVDPGLVKAWRLAGGTVAGRIPLAELLAAVGAVSMPGTDAARPPSLCTQGSVFGQLRSDICKQSDVNQTSALDFSPGAACDAVSVGIAVTGDSVRVGSIVATPDAGNECYPTADGAGPLGQPGLYRCP